MTFNIPLPVAGALPVPGAGPGTGDAPGDSPAALHYDRNWSLGWQSPAQPHVRDAGPGAGTWRSQGRSAPPLPTSA